MAVFRKLLPKNACVDKFAFTFMHVGIIGLVIFEVFHVLPKYHTEYTQMYYIQAFIAIFFATQIFSNMYCMILVDTTVRSPHVKLPFSLFPGWRYCPDCQVNTPPRSHHCPVCNICVFKRDHHCVFTGNCVGFHNHRYFIAMISYLWFSCLYAFLYNKDFYAEILGDYDATLFFKCLFPMLVWACGYVTKYQFGIMIVMVINMAAMIFFSLLVGFQILFITRGQTQFELRKRNRDHNLGVIDNWKLVLGESWYLIWFSCFLPSALRGNGIEFKRNIRHMSVDEDHLKI